jgi:hypothetical protein
LLRRCRQDSNPIVRVHLRPGEQVSGTVVFAILHREKSNKVFGKRSSRDYSQTAASSTCFWEALFARLLPNGYFIYVLVTV